MSVMVEASCPKCGHSESWSVWIGERGEAMGKCHRASCGHLGTLEGAYLIPAPKKEPRVYTRARKDLTDKQRELIRGLFGLDGSDMGYNEFDDRFLLDVYGPVGYNKRGTIAYSLSGGTPKSFSYPEKLDEPFIHWAERGDAPGTIIVEDWFSAEKAAKAGANAVAIMGTNLTQAAVTEIAEWGSGSTYLALDRDAYPKTLGYLAKYREQFPYGLYAWSLARDLKYESVERIREALLNGRTNFNDRTTPTCCNDGGS